MPSLLIKTNVDGLDEVTVDLLMKACSKAVSELLGKPESFVLVSFETCRMIFGGTSAPCAYVVCADDVCRPCCRMWMCRGCVIANGWWGVECSIFLVWALSAQRWIHRLWKRYLGSWYVIADQFPVMECNMHACAVCAGQTRDMFTCQGNVAFLCCISNRWNDIADTTGRKCGNTSESCVCTVLRCERAVGLWMEWDYLRIDTMHYASRSCCEQCLAFWRGAFHSLCVKSSFLMALRRVWPLCLACSSLCMVRRDVIYCGRLGGREGCGVGCYSRCWLFWWGGLRCVLDWRVVSGSFSPLCCADKGLAWFLQKTRRVWQAPAGG